MSDPSPEEGGVAVEETLDVTAAQSSGAEPQGVKTLHDAVSAALGEAEASPAADEPGKEQSAKTPDGEEPAKAGTDPTDEELKQFSLTAQNRIRELVSLRKTAEAEAQEVKQQVEVYRSRAEQMDKLEGYMRDNRLSQTDVSNTLALAALMQTGRHAEALQALTPIYSQLLQMTGNVLPPELQQEVESGYITPARAIELQRERMANKTASELAKQDNDRRQAEARANEVEGLTRLYGETATHWENSRKSSDPDFSLKQELVSTIVEAELVRIANSDPSKLPRDAKGVNAILDAALAKVDKNFASYRPKPTPRDHETGRPASAGSKTKPASLMDAVNAALS